MLTSQFLREPGLLGAVRENV